MAQSVGRVIALLFHDRGTRRGSVVSSTPWPHFNPGKDSVPILQEAGWAPGLIGLTENLDPTRIQSRTVQSIVSRYSDEYYTVGNTYFEIPFSLFRTFVSISK